MKKRFLAVILALALCLGLMPTAFAASSDFVIENGVLTKYNGPGGDVVIPDGVTSIGDHAFSGCGSLTSVTIPSSVTSIENWAFNACWNLTSVTIPSSVTSIGADAFKSCWNLTSVTIPDSVTSIGDHAFMDCYGLTSVTFPDSMTHIGDLAFWGCRSLTSVTFPDSITHIGDSAFAFCESLTSVTIPDSMTHIGNCAFQACYGLTSVTLPNNMTSMGNMFRGCSKLAEIHIPDSVTSIEAGAFDGCSGLTEIRIPAGVTSIDDRAFSDGYPMSDAEAAPPWLTAEGCPGLTRILVAEDNPAYASRDGVLFTKDMTRLIQYPGGKTETAYTVPDSVTEITDLAFAVCDGLSEIIVPDSVQRIGDYAFAHCPSLRRVELPAGISASEIGDLLFWRSGLTSIPENLPRIGPDMFTYNSALVNAVIPDGISTISSEAFWWCDNLEQVTIPTSVTSIGDGAFRNCDSLTDVYYCGSETQWARITIEERNNAQLMNATIHFNGETDPDPTPSQPPVDDDPTPPQPPVVDVPVIIIPNKPDPTPKPAEPEPEPEPEPIDPMKVFTDLKPDAYYLDAVAWAVEKNITTGTTDTTFSPKENCTHAQILTFLWRAAGEPASNVTLPFSTTGKEYYLGAAKWAYEKGMIDKNFNHKTPCTRADAVNYIWQAFGKQSASYNGQFTDVPTNSPYTTAVAWALDNGVTTGTTATAFAPDQICNRGQIVTFLYRAYK